MNDFIILLNKSEGKTSAASLSSVKRNVNKKTGHTGTLDKFASGVLIALTGRYTKFTEKYMNLKKTYLATIEFGKETTTLDREGEVIAVSSSYVSKEDLERVLKEKFSGPIKQTPPIYSALKINGKRASDRVRSGEEVELSEREINIYSSSLISFENNTAVIRFTVSRGTYIRSLARDIALSLNSRAYLKNLVRERVGVFDISDTLSDNDIDLFKKEYNNQSKDEYIMCIGVFDGVHIGHGAIISRTVQIARESGYKSLVITFNKNPKRNDCIMTLSEKLKAISLFAPDSVEVLEWNESLEKTSGARFMLSLQKKYNLRGIVCGADFSVGNIANRITSSDLNLFFNEKDIHIVDDVGCEDIKRVSSTYIQSLIKGGKTEQAKKLLYFANSANKKC